METEELAWKEIEKDIELYKFYLELVLKSNAFIFGITGALLSFYFANTGKELIVYSLLLPIVMNIGFFLICLLSIGYSVTMQERHYELCEKAGVELAYEMSPLPNLLRLFSVIYGMVSVGLLVLFIIQLY